MNRELDIALGALVLDLSEWLEVDIFYNELMYKIDSRRSSHVRGGYKEQALRYAISEYLVEQAELAQKETLKVRITNRTSPVWPQHWVFGPYIYIGTLEVAPNKFEDVWYIVKRDIIVRKYGADYAEWQQAFDPTYSTNEKDQKSWDLYTAWKLSKENTHVKNTPKLCKDCEFAEHPHIRYTIHDESITCKKDRTLRQLGHQCHIKEQVEQKPHWKRNTSEGIYLGSFNPEGVRIYDVYLMTVTGKEELRNQASDDSWSYNGNNNGAYTVPYHEDLLTDWGSQDKFYRPAKEMYAKWKEEHPWSFTKLFPTTPRLADHKYLGSFIAPIGLDKERALGKIDAVDVYVKPYLYDGRPDLLMVGGNSANAWLSYAIPIKETTDQTDTPTIWSHRYIYREAENLYHWWKERQNNNDQSNS